MSIFDAFGYLGGLGGALGAPLGPLGASPAGQAFGSLHPAARQLMHQQQSLMMQQRFDLRPSPTVMAALTPEHELVEVPRREGWCSLCRKHHLMHCEWDVIEKLAAEREKQDAEYKVREKIEEWKQTPEGKQWMAEHGSK